ncbi:MAG: serine/threonine-protein phosphatase [Lachnospiraceae bacterium]|nr:serine/threonine-protein phosphatase [Lachnospiraceae bacterium]
MKHNMVLGGMKKSKYQDHEYDLSPGDAIFIYTDGVPEASDAEHRMYGVERMIEALNAYMDDAPDELLSHLRQDIDKFVGGADQFDDLTMLSFVYNGKKETE